MIVSCGIKFSKMFLIVSLKIETCLFTSRLERLFSLLNNSPKKFFARLHIYIHIYIYIYIHITFYIYTYNIFGVSLTWFSYFSYITLFVLHCFFRTTCFRLAKTIVQLSILILRITMYFVKKIKCKVNMYNIASVQYNYLWMITSKSWLK